MGPASVFGFIELSNFRVDSICSKYFFYCSKFQKKIENPSVLYYNPIFDSESP